LFLLTFDCRSDEEEDEEAGEQLIADIFGASDEEEEFVVRFQLNQQ